MKIKRGLAAFLRGGEKGGGLCGAAPSSKNLRDKQTAPPQKRSSRPLSRSLGAAFWEALLIFYPQRKKALLEILASGAKRGRERARRSFAPLSGSGTLIASQKRRATREPQAPSRARLRGNGASVQGEDGRRGKKASQAKLGSARAPAAPEVDV